MPDQVPPPQALWYCGGAYIGDGKSTHPYLFAHLFHAYDASIDELFFDAQTAEIRSSNGGMHCDQEGQHSQRLVQCLRGNEVFTGPTLTPRAESLRSRPKWSLDVRNPT